MSITADGRVWDRITDLETTVRELSARLDRTERLLSNIAGLIMADSVPVEPDEPAAP